MCVQVLFIICNSIEPYFLKNTNKSYTRISNNNTEKENLFKKKGYLLSFNHLFIQLPYDNYHFSSNLASIIKANSLDRCQLKEVVVFNYIDR